MIRMALKVVSVLALSVLLVLLVTSGPPQARAQSQAQPKAQPAMQAPAQPQWLSIAVVRVKPDMLTEWQEFQKNESIPALQKGGVKWRNAWETAVFGEAFEYVFATPIESFAQFDGDSPIRKALGAEGAQAYGAKARRLIAGAHTYGVQYRPDLSYEREMTGPPKLAVVNVLSIAPGRTLEFESLIKNDVLPVMKRAEVGGYLVHQTVLGGNPNEYVTLTLLDTFADLDKGHPFVRVLGPEGANKLFQKVAGIITHAERVIARYNAELSISPPAQAPAK